MRIIVLLIVTFFYSQSIFALSSKDIGLYKSIFNDYRNGNFDKGDKDIAKLDDLILMGHVQALKLLHPTAHRSSFLELRDWLSEYSDHYEARRIYKLGVRRMPDGAKKPKKTPSAPRPGTRGFRAAAPRRSATSSSTARR